LECGTPEGRVVHTRGPCRDHIPVRRQGGVRVRIGFQEIYAGRAKTSRVDPALGQLADLTGSIRCPVKPMALHRISGDDTRQL
jgi:hypothetical protein